MSSLYFYFKSTSQDKNKRKNKINFRETFPDYIQSIVYTQLALSEVNRKYNKTTTQFIQKWLVTFLYEIRRKKFFEFFEKIKLLIQSPHYSTLASAGSSAGASSTFASHFSTLFSSDFSSVFASHFSSHFSSVFSR